MSKYVPDEKRETYKNNEDINFSEHLLEYKNKDTVYINLFSNKLAKFISRFSKEKISAEINKLALIAVPSSKVHKKTSAIKKSIEIIDEWYDNGDLKKIYGCDKEIINYKDLLKRVKDVPTAHLGEGRATPIEHIKSIECENDNLNNEKIAYIILDDITTTGDTMQACNEILLESGANPKNIFNIAIGATVREEGEEI